MYSCTCKYSIIVMLFACRSLLCDYKIKNVISCSCIQWMFFIVILWPFGTFRPKEPMMRPLILLTAENFILIAKNLLQSPIQLEIHYRDLTVAIAVTYPHESSSNILLYITKISRPSPCMVSLRNIVCRPISLLLKKKKVGAPVAA